MERRNYMIVAWSSQQIWHLEAVSPNIVPLTTWSNNESSSPTAAKYVVILTYQRCGSSFFGDVFGLNPDAFYVYEPLDSVYTSMYGTSPGWNVPSDITNNRDGTARKVPQHEIDAVADFLRHLLTGEVEKLPTTTLVQNFWAKFGRYHKEMSEFTKCLKEHKLTDANCSKISSQFCGKRFAEKPPDRLEQCRRLLAGDGNAEDEGLSSQDARIFENYRACIQSQRHDVDLYCTEKLQQIISEHRLRAAKVVRATMDSMRPLLRAMPTLRVIHLFRDPRAVALSRLKFDPSGRGAYTQQIIKESWRSRYFVEASLYCHHVIADVRSRLALEREFPGRIMAVRYEDVVANAEKIFRQVYQLLNEPPPDSVMKAMTKLASKGQEKNLTTKWKNVLTSTDEAEIVYRCSDFFNVVGISPSGIRFNSSSVDRH